MFPSFVEYKKIIKKSGLILEKEFDYRLTKNISKKICILKFNMLKHKV